MSYELCTSDVWQNAPAFFAVKNKTESTNYEG